MRTIPSFPQVLLAAAMFVQLATALTVTDPFTDPANWGKPLIAGSGKFTVANGRMNYTATQTAEAFAASQRESPILPSTCNWSMKVDAHLDAFNLTKDGQFSDVFLGFCKTGDLVKTHVTFEFGRGMWNPDDRDYFYIQDDVRVNGVSINDDLDDPLVNSRRLTSPDVSLRMDYIAADHSLTYYFDSDGGANGYEWELGGTANLASGIYNMKMKATDTFTPFLSASSYDQTVTAGQAYLSNLEITVDLKPQTITFPPLPAKGYGDPDFAPGASASSGLPVSYSSTNPLVATIVAGTGKIRLIGAGTTTITTHQAGDRAWDPAPEVSRELVVGKGTPVITWVNPKPITYGTPLSATQLNAKTTVPGSFVFAPTFGDKLSAGSHALSATFTPKDATQYNSATKQVSLTVNKGVTKVIIAGLKQTYNGQPHPVTVTTVPAGLQVVIDYGGDANAPVNAGSVPVTAKVSDANHTGSAKGTLAIAKAKQTITFLAPSAMRVGDADAALAAVATSGLTVSYASSAPAVATIVAGKIHAVAPGLATITASQIGDTTNWLAATAVKQKLTVLSEDQDIRVLYAQMKSLVEARDVPGFQHLFAPDYLHQGQDFAAEFAAAPDMFDAVKTFTMKITSIKVTGSDAMVTGAGAITFNNRTAAETWTEPDTTGDSPGIGWLHKTADGWRVMGDQLRAQVKVTGIHFLDPGDDHYFFRFQVESSLQIESIGVSGPAIGTTELESNPGSSGFTGFAGHFTIAQRPPVGSVYAWVVHFTDGSQETFQNTLRSWVPTAPVVTVTPGVDTAMIRWTNVKAAVPNAERYGVRIYGADGESDSIWQGSEDLPLTQTSIAFNADGEATGDLVSGQSYTAVVTIFDRYGNYAFRTCEFTMPAPPAAPASIVSKRLTYTYPGGWFREDFGSDGTGVNRTSSGEVNDITYTYSATGNTAEINTTQESDGYTEVTTMTYASATTGTFEYWGYDNGNLDQHGTGTFAATGNDIAMHFNP